MKNLDLEFHIPDVFCQNCVKTVENALYGRPKTSLDHFEIKQFQFNLSQKRLKLSIHFNENKISADIIIQKLKEIVDEIGFGMELVSEIPVKELLPQDRTHLIGAILGLSLGFAFMLFGLGLFSFAFMTTWPFILASNAVLIYLALPFVRHAWQRFWAGLKNYPNAEFLNMDSLFVMTGLIIMTSSICSLFMPIFSNPLQAGFLIFGFRHLGCMVQAFLHQKMGMSDSLMETFQNQSYQLKDGKRILARDLKPGMNIVLKAGEVLPVDASVERKSPNAEIKYTLKDGGYFSTQSTDIPTALAAGVELHQGELLLKVERNLEKSHLGLIDEAIKKMKQEQHSNLLNKVNRALQWFIPMILMLALISGLLVAHFFSIALAIKCVTAVLVSACPCTLGLIIPMAVRLGAFRASQEKVLFQSAEALEAAAQADTFVLDYNGTLTTGVPKFEPFNYRGSAADKTREDCLAIIRCMEEKVIQKRGENRFARAILKQMDAELQNCDIKLDLTEGAFIDDIYKCQLNTSKGKFLFGNNQLLNELQKQDHVCPQAVHLLWQNDTGNKVYLGYLVEKDNLRADAKVFIEKLREKGKMVTVCTGADEDTAKKIAQQLATGPHSIAIKANCRLVDKLAYVQSLKKDQRRKVVMIGDAINDQAALAGSDLGIWFKSEKSPKHWGDDLLCRSAHMVVYSDSLMSILSGLDIAAQTYRVIYQNLAFSLIYNLLSLTLACGLLLSFGISLHPALGVALMILQSACLGFNTWHGICQKNYAPTDAGLSLKALAAT